MASQFKIKKSEERELGFGSATNTTKQRSLNKDGSANIHRNGIAHFNPINIYHNLVKMSWLKFILLVLTGYFIMNILFATTYFLIGIENLTGMKHATPARDYWECFFFSTQALTTVGFGRIAPISFATNVVTSIESMVGLLSFALATGLLYGKFSRPTAKILYSEHALIAPYKDITAFMFRIANARSNQLIEAEASLIIAFDIEENGKKVRKFQNVTLELQKINILALSWTIVHPIDDNSPLKNLTHEDFEKSDIEFFIMLKAVDDTYAQTVYSRSSYKASEIVWNAKFKTIIGKTSEGKPSLDLHRIDDFEVLKLA